MPKTLVMVFVCACAELNAQSFQEELLLHRHEVLQAIGPARLERVLEVSRSKEIYRITQLLDIPDIGEKTVMKLGGVLGYWFEYQPSIDVCTKLQSC